VTYEIRDQADNLLYKVENSADLLTDRGRHGIDLLPGHRIIATKLLTGQQKELELIDLTVDSVDVENDIISGTAPPDAFVEAAAYDDCPWCGWGLHYAFRVRADENGHWSADFAARGHDITADMEAHALVHDADGDATLVHPGARRVPIDIKPGSYPNAINLAAQGSLAVAILTGESFDAASMQPDSAVFAGAWPQRWRLKDVDKDGDQDMILHYMISELNLDAGCVEGWLYGVTLDGLPVQGVDSLKIVPAHLLSGRP